MLVRLYHEHGGGKGGDAGGRKPAPGEEIRGLGEEISGEEIRGLGFNRFGGKILGENFGNFVVGTL